MTSVILIPWPMTDWQASGRYASNTPVAINQRGEEQLERWIEMIAVQAPTGVYGAGPDPAEQTARLIAKGLKIRNKKADGLEEIDLGLWEGLTQAELKKRFPKPYKQWKEDPSGIRPPEGEAVSDAGERLAEVIRGLSRKHRSACFAVVLGPLALAAVRCRLENKGYDSFWSLQADEPVRYLINVEENKAVQTP